MFGKTRQQLARIEAALDEIRVVLEEQGGALNLATPGGLAVVAAEAKQARTAAESAFVGVQTLASQATAKPGLGELAGAVATNTEALRAVQAAVRTATGPQPALPEPAPVKPAAEGMGSRVPKTRGGKP
jgi:hypothetical protein